MQTCSRKFEVHKTPDASRLDQKILGTRVGQYLTELIREIYVYRHIYFYTSLTRCPRHSHWNIKHGQYIYFKHCLSVRNIPDCWHSCNFTITTLHYSPTNPMCHGELLTSQFTLRFTSFFICDVTSCQGRTNPWKHWILGPSLAGSAWWFYLWVFVVKLATCFRYSACIFHVAPKFLEHI